MHVLKRSLSIVLVLILFCTAALAEELDLTGVADASDMTDVVDVVQPGMTPVTAGQLNDGTYAVAVDCSSSMFKIVGCDLVVEDGAMTATLTMKSDSYLYLYPGTPEAAAGANVADLLPLSVDGERYSFEFPVSALDAGVDCAAFSARKQLWYPRTLVFRADSLPQSAWKSEDLATAHSLELVDGDYTVEAALAGGRATIQNPVALRVSEGACEVTLVFNTSKIDYVRIDGEKVLPEPAGDGMAFTIPVAAFDRGLSLIVDSTAIQPATEVPYTITFDSATLAAAE